MSDLCTREAYQVIVEYFPQDRESGAPETCDSTVEARPGGNAWYSPVEYGWVARKCYASAVGRAHEGAIKSVYLTRDGVIVAQARY